MFLRELRREVTTIRGVGPATARLFHSLGLRTVADLLLHFPRGYEDRRFAVPLCRAAATEKAFVEATVASLEEIGRGRARTLKALITDGTGQAALVCFGRPFLRNVLKPAGRIRVWGSFKVRFGELQSSDFEVELSRGAEAPRFEEPGDVQTARQRRLSKRDRTDSGGSVVKAQNGILSSERS